MMKGGVYCMEDKAFEFIERLDAFGLGTAILFLIVIGFIFFTILKFLKKITKDHDDKLIKEYKHDQEYKKKITDTEKLQCDLKTICDNLDTITKTIEENNTETMARIDDIQNQLTAIKEESENQNSKMEISIKKISDNTEVLTGSDMEQNRHTIVEAYNKYVVPRKPIDIYTLQTVRDAYKWYSAENGNSHISALMQDFERLPRNDLNAVYTDYENGKIKVLHGFLEDKIVNVDENSLVQ